MASHCPRFNTYYASASDYTRFITSLRNAVTGSRISLYGGKFRVLPDPNSVRDSDRFVLVVLSNSVEEITLAINVTDLYVVGYRTNQGVSYHFKGCLYDGLFQGTRQRIELPFDGSYGQLARAAQLGQAGSNEQTFATRHRERINLGIAHLDAAIRALYMPSTSQQDRARGLTIVIQMVSEAARFSYIEQQVVNSTAFPVNEEDPSREEYPSYDEFCPNPFMISLENNWGALSEAIQQACDGLFPNPVRLGPSTSYFHVQQLIDTVAVIKYVKPTPRPPDELGM